MRTVLPYAAAVASTCIVLVVAAVSAACRLRESERSLRAKPAHWSHLFGSLTRIFSVRYGWWFSVVLLRRIALVGVISFVPYWSPFLPLSLFIVIQASAMLQHFARPYAYAMDNKCELASLYILLLNYFSSTVQGFLRGSYDNAMAIWFSILLIGNIVFVLALAGRVLMPFWKRCKHQAKILRSAVGECQFRFEQCAVVG